jgi:3-oxoadipate enol-lactonase
VPFVALNDVRLHYVEAGSSFPVVLVHGLACGWRMWRSQIRALAPRYRVIAYDQRGHGLSSAPEDPAAYSEEILADDLAGLIRGLGLERAAIVGLSMGGSVALMLAERHPALVAALVLAGTGSGSDDLDTWHRRTEEWSEAARLRGSRAFATRMLVSPSVEAYLRTGRNRARRHMRLLIEQHPGHGLANITRHVLGRRRSIYTRRPALQRLKVPALVICGSRDAGCRKPSAFLADTIPDAEMVWLREVGHMTCLEAPKLFNATLLRFLERSVAAETGPAAERAAGPEMVKRRSQLPHEGGTNAA